MDDAAASSSPSAVAEEETVSSAALPVAAPRVITVAITNFAFEPSVIAVKKGERVTLAFRGVEGVHGVAIEGLGINVAVPPGETVTVELPTDVAGTFAFFCSIPCGPGHREMRGTIVIE